MKQAISTPTTRRTFSKWLAAAAAGAAMAIPATALASPDDDRALLQLEEEIFQAWEASHAHDDEIYGPNGLNEVRNAEYGRLLEAEKAQGRFMSSREHGVIPGQSHTKALGISSPRIDEAHLGPANRRAAMEQYVGLEANSDLHC